MIRSSDPGIVGAERLARGTDPETSHLSAEATVREGKAAAIAGKIMEIILDQPELGWTSGELADVLHLDHSQVWRRCSDLKKATKTRPALIRKGPPRRWHRSRRLQVTLWPIDREETQAELL